MAAFREVLAPQRRRGRRARALSRKVARRRGSRSASASSSVTSSSTFSKSEAAKIPGVKYLVQGTLYPDVIESKTPQSKAGHKIKSHHNVGGLPERMGLLADRAVAIAVQGRSARARARVGSSRPRSSSGSRSRARGSRFGSSGTSTKERLEVVRGADAIVRDEIEAPRWTRTPGSISRC